MYLITLFFVVLFTFFLVFPKVKAGGNVPQSDNEKNLQAQREQERRAKNQHEIENILKDLITDMQHERDIRKQDRPPLDKARKEQRLKDQFELDNLEKKIRGEIQHFFELYARRQPLNEEYEQKVSVFNKDIQDFYGLIERIGNRRIHDMRMDELRSLNILRQKLSDRRETEKKQISLEEPAKDLKTREERAAEQEKLRFLEQKLYSSITRVRDWHIKNEPINEIHTQILTELNTNLKNFNKHTDLMDERRRKERLAHVQQITKMLAELNAFRQYELEQRNKEQPARSEMSFVQRKKDEFVGDKLDGAIRSRLNNLLQQISQNYPLDNEYAHQRDLINRDWQKLIAHLEIVKERRRQEQQNVYIPRVVGPQVRFTQQRPSRNF